MECYLNRDRERERAPFLSPQPRTEAFRAPTLMVSEDHHPPQEQCMIIVPLVPVPVQPCLETLSRKQYYKFQFRHSIPWRRSVFIQFLGFLYRDLRQSLVDLDALFNILSMATKMQMSVGSPKSVLDEFNISDDFDSLLDKNVTSQIQINRNSLRMKIPLLVRILDVRSNLTKDLREDDNKVIAGSSSLTHCKSVATELAKCFNQSS